MPHGYWIFYLENGNIDKEGEFSMGEQSGQWKIYSNGKLDSQGELLKGEMVGEWKFYKRNGKLKDVLNFNSDVE